MGQCLSGLAGSSPGLEKRGGLAGHGGFSIRGIWEALNGGICLIPLAHKWGSVDQGDQVLVCGLRDPRLTGLLDGGGASGLCNWAESRREGDENNKTEDNLCI